MKMKKVLLSMLHQTAYITAKVRNKYVNGVATGEIEFVSVTLMTPVGEVQMLFPAREGAAEEFNRRYAFLQKVAPEELGIITDTQIRCVRWRLEYQNSGKLSRQRGGFMKKHKYDYEKIKNHGNAIVTCVGVYLTAPITFPFFLALLLILRPMVIATYYLLLGISVLIRKFRPDFPVIDRIFYDQLTESCRSVEKFILFFSNGCCSAWYFSLVICGGVSERLPTESRNFTTTIRRKNL